MARTTVLDARVRERRRMAEQAFRALQRIITDDRRSADEVTGAQEIVKALFDEDDFRSLIPHLFTVPHD